MHAPEPALRRFVSERFGVDEAASWQRLDRGGGSARVWLVPRVGGGTVGQVIIKQHLGSRGFVQERQALSQWSHEGRIGTTSVPRLLAVDEQLKLLVLERLPGRTPSEDDPPELAAAQHRAAGRFLAALHRLAITDPDPMPLHEALARRWQAWHASCVDLLEPDARSLCAAIEPEVELFRAERRVACHRDFTPSNWLWDASGSAPGLAVVDFEHARLDLGWVDLAKLAVGAWQGHPVRLAAFLDGYGRWDADGWSRLRWVVALHGLGCLAWGRRHGDSQFSAEGRRTMALLGRPRLGLS